MHVYAEGKHRKVYVGKDGKYFYNLNGVRVYTRKKPIRGSPKTKKDCPKYGVRKSDGKCKKKPGRKSTRRSSTKKTRSTRRKTERECRPYGVRKSDGQCRKKPGRKPGSKNRVKTTSPKRTATARASPKRTATARASPKRTATARASPKRTASTVRANTATTSSPRRANTNTTSSTKRASTIKTSPRRASTTRASPKTSKPVNIGVYDVETSKIRNEIWEIENDKTMKEFVNMIAENYIEPGHRVLVYPAIPDDYIDTTFWEWFDNSGDKSVRIHMETIDEYTNTDDPGYIYNDKDIWDV